MLSKKNRARRSGMILLVIVAFLALFTIMGITYLLYADSQLRNSIDEIKRLDKRDYRAIPEIDTNYLLNFFLERFIYDQPDYEPDIYAVNTGGINYEPKSVFSALRGHSLARNMYGYNYQPLSTSGLNDRPFSGTGKLVRNISIPGTSVTLPENQILNYTYFKSFGQTQILDPERGPRTNLTTLASNSSSWNAPYTYPDFNNLYLAWLKPDGRIGKPSFHLESVFGKMDFTSRSTNPNWINEQGRYMSLRPRPVDNLVPADYNAAGGDPVKLAAIVNQRQTEQALFPYPDEFGYDVKNLESYPDNSTANKNDSIWIDVGSPVFYNIDGRKYKILVAPLVIDLDGRVNLNYSGNNLAGGNHGSNQGWGTWEINPQKLNASLPLNSSARPAPLLTIPPPFTTSLISPVDFNGYFESGAGAVGGPLYPGQGSVNRFDSFVNFPTRSYGNLSLAELANHPSTIPVVDRVSPFSNYWDSIGFSYSTTNKNELKNLLRWRGRGSDPTDSSSLIVNSAAGPFGAGYVGDPNTEPVQNWNLRTAVTSLSSGLARPSFVPYFVNGTSNPNQLASGSYYPKPSSSDTYNAPPNPPTAPGSISDLNSNRITSEAATLLGINLSRNLTSYPAPDLTDFTGITGIDGPGRIPSGSLAVVATCNRERQDFAQEIFQALLKITGVKNMTAAPIQTPGSTDSDYEANRYLAQLAVNIVDFIDNDDVMTEFVWKNDTSTPVDPTKHERVFGNENKKLFVNEVYAEIQNDPSDTFPMVGMKRPADKDFEVNFWIELVNPLPSSRSEFKEYLEQNPRISSNDSPVYQIKVFDLPATDPNLKIFEASNPIGKPGVPAKLNINNFNVDNSTKLPVGQTLANYENSNLSKVIQGAGSNYAGNELSNTGFMVLSSPADFPGSGAIGYAGLSDLQKLANIRTSSLRYTIPKNDTNLDPARISTFISNKKHCVVLQKLANPYLAPQSDPAVANYNPYITVDVFDEVKLNDGVTHDTDDARTPPAVQARASTMRRQPYQDSRKTQTSALRVETGGPYSSMPQHTFLRHNGEQNSLNATDADTLLELPFTPLLHLDRPIINSLELLNVAGCKPAELTRRFMNENSPGRSASPFNTTQTSPVFYGHKVPWSDDSNRLSRFLEIASPVSRLSGSLTGAREFGKININSIWHPEIFNALADVNTTANMNGFDQAEVNTVFMNMVNSRSPSGFPGSPSDRPFWSLGIGGSIGSDDLTTGPRGLENTVLRSNCFDLPAMDISGNTRTQYQKKELLSKIFNNITTKSNVFAVWLTVGYFEVTDDSTQPPKLGIEMGLREGTSIRPKMFAIIDRSKMVAARNLTGTPPSRSVLPNIAAGVDVDLEAAGVGTFRLYDVRDTSVQINLQDGMAITFEPDTPLEETVFIRKFNGRFVANFRNSHSGGYDAVIRGNPGPWTNFSISDSNLRSPGLIPASEIYTER